MTGRLDESIFGDVDSHQESRTSRRRLRPRRRRGVTIVAAVLLFAAGAWLATTVLLPWVSGLTAEKDYQGQGDGAVTVVIQPGDTGRDIAANLERAGVVRTAGAFESALADGPGSQLQPGTYQLRSRMSGAAALSLLRDPASRSVRKVTVREGLWRDETFAVLAKATGRPLSEYQAAAADPGLLGLPAVAKGNVEGYLFPATYSFEPSDDAQDQLRTMISEAVKQLQGLGLPEQKWQRTVIVASVIEGEARRPEDRGKVARVIENRLAAKQMLQMDSTVNYAVQRRAVTTTDAERRVDKGYGTYARYGLPVAPVGNPGLTSLRAAMSPTPGDWLFFVTVNPDTGETRFATTDTDHAANVAQFQAWCQAHSGRC